MNTNKFDISEQLMHNMIDNGCLMHAQASVMPDIAQAIQDSDLDGLKTYNKQPDSIAHELAAEVAMQYLELHNFQPTIETAIIESNGDLRRKHDNNYLGQCLQLNGKKNLTKQLAEMRESEDTTVPPSTVFPEITDIIEQILVPSKRLPRPPSDSDDEYDGEDHTLNTTISKFELDPHQKRALEERLLREAERMERERLKREAKEKARQERRLQHDERVRARELMADMPTEYSYVSTDEYPELVDAEVMAKMSRSGRSTMIVEEEEEYYEEEDIIDSQYGSYTDSINSSDLIRTQTSSYDGRGSRGRHSRSRKVTMNPDLTSIQGSGTKSTEGSAYPGGGTRSGSSATQTSTHTRSSATRSGSSSITRGNNKTDGYPTLETDYPGNFSTTPSGSTDEGSKYSYSTYSSDRYSSQYPGSQGSRSTPGLSKGGTTTSTRPRSITDYSYSKGNDPTLDSQFSQQYSTSTYSNSRGDEPELDSQFSAQYSTKSNPNNAPDLESQFTNHYSAGTYSYKSGDGPELSSHFNPQYSTSTYSYDNKGDGPELSSHFSAQYSTGDSAQNNKFKENGNSTSTYSKDLDYTYETITVDENGNPKHALVDSLGPPSNSFGVTDTYDGPISTKLAEAFTKQTATKTSPSKTSTGDEDDEGTSEFTYETITIDSQGRVLTDLTQPKTKTSASKTSSTIDSNTDEDTAEFTYETITVDEEGKPIKRDGSTVPLVSDYTTNVIRKDADGEIIGPGGSKLKPAEVVTMGTDTLEDNSYSNTTQDNNTYSSNQNSSGNYSQNSSNQNSSQKSTERFGNEQRPRKEGQREGKLADIFTKTKSNTGSNIDSEEGTDSGEYTYETISIDPSSGLPKVPPEQNPFAEAIQEELSKQSRPDAPTEASYIPDWAARFLPKDAKEGKVVPRRYVDGKTGDEDYTYATIEIDPETGKPLIKDPELEKQVERYMEQEKSKSYSYSTYSNTTQNTPKFGKDNDDYSDDEYTYATVSIDENGHIPVLDKIAQQQKSVPTQQSSMNYSATATTSNKGVGGDLKRFQADESKESTKPKSTKPIDENMVDTTISVDNTTTTAANITQESKLPPIMKGSKTKTEKLSETTNKNFNPTLESEPSGTTLESEMTEPTPGSRGSPIKPTTKKGGKGRRTNPSIFDTTKSATRESSIAVSESTLGRPLTALEKAIAMHQKTADETSTGEYSTTESGEYTYATVTLDEKGKPVINEEIRRSIERQNNAEDNASKKFQREYPKRPVQSQEDMIESMSTQPEDASNEWSQMTKPMKSRDRTGSRQALMKSLTASNTTGSGVKTFSDKRQKPKWEDMVNGEEIKTTDSESEIVSSESQSVDDERNKALARFISKPVESSENTFTELEEDEKPKSSTTKLSTTRGDRSSQQNNRFMEQNDKREIPSYSTNTQLTKNTTQFEQNETTDSNIDTVTTYDTADSNDPFFAKPKPGVDPAKRFLAQPQRTRTATTTNTGERKTTTTSSLAAAIAEKPVPGKFASLDESAIDSMLDKSNEYSTESGTYTYESLSIDKDAENNLQKLAQEQKEKDALERFTDQPKISAEDAERMQRYKVASNAPGGPKQRDQPKNWDEMINNEQMEDHGSTTVDSEEKTETADTSEMTDFEKYMKGKKSSSSQKLPPPPSGLEGKKPAEVESSFSQMTSESESNQYTYASVSISPEQAAKLIEKTGTAVTIPERHRKVRKQDEDEEELNTWERLKRTTSRKDESESGTETNDTNIDSTTESPDEFARMAAAGRKNASNDPTVTAPTKASIDDYIKQSAQRKAEAEERRRKRQQNYSQDDSEFIDDVATPSNPMMRAVRKGKAVVNEPSLDLSGESDIIDSTSTGEYVDNVIINVGPDGTMYRQTFDGKRADVEEQKNLPRYSEKDLQGYHAPTQRGVYGAAHDRNKDASAWEKMKANKLDSEPMWDDSKTKPLPKIDRRFAPPKDENDKTYTYDTVSVEPEQFEKIKELQRKSEQPVDESYSYESEQEKQKLPPPPPPSSEYSYSYEPDEGLKLHDEKSKPLRYPIQDAPSTNEIGQMTSEEKQPSNKAVAGSNLSGRTRDSKRSPLLAAIQAKQQSSEAAPSDTYTYTTVEPTTREMENLRISQYKPDEQSKTGRRFNPDVPADSFGYASKRFPEERSDDKSTAQSTVLSAMLGKQQPQQQSQKQPDGTIESSDYSAESEDFTPKNVAHKNLQYAEFSSDIYRVDGDEESAKLPKYQPQVSQTTTTKTSRAQQQLGPLANAFNKQQSSTVSYTYETVPEGYSPQQKASERSRRSTRQPTEQQPEQEKKLAPPPKAFRSRRTTQQANESTGEYNTDSSIIESEGEPVFNIPKDDEEYRVKDESSIYSEDLAGRYKGSQSRRETTTRQSQAQQQQRGPLASAFKKQQTDTVSYTYETVPEKSSPKQKPVVTESYSYDTAQEKYSPRQSSPKQRPAATESYTYETVQEKYSPKQSSPKQKPIPTESYSYETVPDKSSPKQRPAATASYTYETAEDKTTPQQKPAERSRRQTRQPVEQQQQYERRRESSVNDAADPRYTGSRKQVPPNSRSYGTNSTIPYDNETATWDEDESYSYTYQTQKSPEQRPERKSQPPQRTHRSRRTVPQTYESAEYNTDSMDSSVIETGDGQPVFNIPKRDEPYKYNDESSLYSDVVPGRYEAKVAQARKDAAPKPSQPEKPPGPLEAAYNKQPTVTASHTYETVPGNYSPQQRPAERSRRQTRQPYEQQQQLPEPEKKAEPARPSRRIDPDFKPTPAQRLAPGNYYNSFEPDNSIFESTSSAPESPQPSYPQRTQQPQQRNIPQRVQQAQEEGPQPQKASAQMQLRPKAIASTQESSTEKEPTRVEQQPQRPTRRTRTQASSEESVSRRASSISPQSTVTQQPEEIQQEQQQPEHPAYQQHQLPSYLQQRPSQKPMQQRPTRTRKTETKVSSTTAEEEPETASSTFPAYEELMPAPLPKPVSKFAAVPVSREGPSGSSIIDTLSSSQSNYVEVPESQMTSSDKGEEEEEEEEKQESSFQPQTTSMTYTYTYETQEEPSPRRSSLMPKRPGSQDSTEGGKYIYKIPAQPPITQFQRVPQPFSKFMATENNDTSAIDTPVTSYTYGSSTAMTMTLKPAALPDEDPLMPIPIKK